MNRLTPPLTDFAAIGADLLRLVEKLARDTRGAFPPGPASITLGLAVSYSEAARNAFAVIAEDPTLGTEARTKIIGLSSEFRAALGIIATRMPGPRGLAEIPSLKGLAEPDGPGIAGFFVSNAAPPVSVSEPARAALDSLRRDVLALAADGPEAVRLLMWAVVDGVAVRR